VRWLQLIEIDSYQTLLEQLRNFFDQTQRLAWETYVYMVEEHNFE